ncbi:hypothetical protein [Streptomyces spinosirectus]
MKPIAARTRRAAPCATTHAHTAARALGPDRRRARVLTRANGAATRLTTRVQDGLEEAVRRPDRGDISTTTVIIWVAAVTGAVLIAGTIAVVIAKYNGKLAGL